MASFTSHLSLRTPVVWDADASLLLQSYRSLTEMDLHKSRYISSSDSPGPRWGSPALASSASFSPEFRPYRSPMIERPYQRPPSLQRFRNNDGVFRSFGGSPGPYPQFSRSPQFVRTPGHTFRTPQPLLRHRSDSPTNRPWTTDSRTKPRGYRGRFGNSQSPRSSPNMNPGGSEDIAQYYSCSMMEDPWASTPPQPINYWLQIRTRPQNT